MSDEREVIAEEHDFTGRLCSEIRLDLNIIIKRMKIGHILKFTTDVPDATTSILKWCRMYEQELFLSELKGDVSIIYIKRIK